MTAHRWGNNILFRSSSNSLISVTQTLEGHFEIVSSPFALCLTLKLLRYIRRVDSFSPTRRRFVWKSKPKQKVPQQNIQ